MELIINENSYMTLEEADDILKTDACVNKLVLDTWDNLDAEVKKRVLVKNTRKLDKNSFGYKGIKANPEQKMQYPRIYRGNHIECPNELKQAIIAFITLDLEYSGSEEIAMIRKGVLSYKIKDASISYRDTDVEKLVSSRKAEIYSEYLNEISIVCF